MLLVGLVLFFVVSLIFCYIHFKKDIIHPSIIYSAVYVLSSLCALYNVDNWGINFKFLTFAILVGGSVEFILIGMLIKYLFEKKNKEPVVFENKPLHVNNIVFAGVCVIGVIIVLMQIYFLIDTANKFGGYDSISGALKIYKDHVSYFNDYKLPHYFSLLCKILEMSSYISIYIFSKKLLENEKISFKVIIKNSVYLVPVVLFFVKELLASSRITLLSVICAFIMIFMILWNCKSQWKKTIKLKILGIGIVAGCIGMVLFYESAALIGRVNQKGLLDYVTCYAGGSIECFNRYGQEPIEKSEIPGAETFYNLYASLDRYGVTHFDIESKHSIHLEYRYYGDSMVGNVYTAYRRWYHDFGIMGVLILNGIMSCFFHLIYYCFRYNKFKYMKHFTVILTGYLSWTLFMHPIDSYLYISVLQITFCTNIFVFMVLCNSLFNIRIREKKLYYNETSVNEMVSLLRKIRI